MKTLRESYFQTIQAWRILFVALVYTGIMCLTLVNTAHAESAADASERPNAQQGILDEECSNGRCMDVPSYCGEDEFCLVLFRFCEAQPAFCEVFFDIPVCEGSECHDIPECDEEEECDDFPECEENEECNDFPECEENEECDDFPECEENEECDDFPECEEDEECDEVTVSTGYINPNPLPDKSVMPVEDLAAHQASRFLAQATLGANYATITQVASFGEELWLEEQFQQPTGYLFPYTDYLSNLAEEGYEEDDQAEEALGGPLTFHMHAWWTQVMTSPDLVRQRVAMALSEIFVISSNVEIIGESPFVITQYYDTLLQHSLGNFRDLLKDITLNPAMAIYLSHLNNEKANPVNGTYPDENYAREVMQLFSIGLFELNPDGSRKKDANGQDIPTYDQDDIREFAKIFTGLSLDTEEGFGFVPAGNFDFYEHAANMRPLKMYDAFHSAGEKKLLNGTLVPAGQTGMQDIEAAIDNLFNHPNVGPFIGKQLIQRLVKSNPSPAYISRVTAAFNGQDGGPRGDMKATIRAILLDPEARRSSINSTDGRLREPFLRLVRLARAFNATTPERTYSAEGYEVAGRLKQYVFHSPSVFNFFQPSYSPNGEIKNAGLVAPEFQITNASTIIEVKNLIDMWLQTGRLEEQTGSLATETVSFGEELALAEEPDALLDRLDTLLTYGTLTDTTRNIIKRVIENESDPTLRVKKAVYLIAVSPDYAGAI